MTMPSRFQIFLILLLWLAVFAGAQEKKIKRTELPPEVEKTVAAQSANATIRGFSQEREKGQTYYEAELSVAGQHKDLLMDPRGNIVEVEEEVAFDSLPAAVRDNLLAKAGKGKVQNVESLTKRGKLVAYEAHVVARGKHSEVQVGPGGESLSHEE